MFESRVQGLGNIRDLMATTTVAEASSEIMMAAVGLDFGKPLVFISVISGIPLGF
jgi:hypothetical protein